MKKILIIIYLISGLPLLHAQDFNFSNENLDEIKKYDAGQLDNGLSVLSLQTEDSTNVFLRFYTDLPDNTDKQYTPFIFAEQQIRQNEILNLPKPWTKNILQNNNIDLVKDDNGYFIKCLLEPANFRIERISKGLIYGKNYPLIRLLTTKEIDELSFKKYKDYYLKFYKPNNSYLMIISQFSADSILKLSEKSFGEWKKKSIPVKKYKLNKIVEPKIAFFDTLSSGQYELSMIFPFALHPFTFDFEKSELLSILIQKELAKRLINNTGLASDINAQFQNDKISGNYSLNVRMTKDSVEKVISIVIEAIEALKSGNFLIDDFEQSKKELITEFKKQNTNENHISWLIINSEINNLSPNYYADFIEDINKTNKAGLQLLAGKYLSYRTSIFTVRGKWYHTLNDIIKLSKDFRIELYNLDGSIKRVIPKGFNGFHILNDYINAVGGRTAISKLKDINIRLTGQYLMNDEEFYVMGEIKHKAPNKYYQHLDLIRPKKDTLLLNIMVYDGEFGMDSTMHGKKFLKGKELQLLQYKSVIIPATKYKEWNFKTKILRADTLNNTYVFVVEFTNPANQKFIDYYDVDKALRYKRIIEDEAYLNKRTILYKKYKKIENEDVLYPFYQLITGKDTMIKLMIRETNTKNRIEKKWFNID